MHRSAIGPRGILLRIGGALALVPATVNPTGASDRHWALTDLTRFAAVHAVPGAVLLGDWVLDVRAAYCSLGRFGSPGLKV